MTWINDPDEVNNLVDDPRYMSQVQDMRAAPSDWTQAFGDLGEVSEKAMKQKMWDGDTQPKTAAPIVQFDRASGTVTLRSETRGASIGYRFSSDGGEESPWTLYRALIAIETGRAIQAKAIRYGFAESAVTNVELEEKP